MDADADQKTPQFVDVANLLRKYGLPAPEIIAADAARAGFDAGFRRSQCRRADRCRKRREAFFLRAAERWPGCTENFDRVMNCSARSASIQCRFIYACRPNFFSTPIFHSQGPRGERRRAAGFSRRLAGGVASDRDHAKKLNVARFHAR